MPTFPRRKADIDALAGAIAAGITANPADYPPATFATAALTAAITAKNAAVTDRQQKEADLGLAVEAENDTYETLTGEMRRLIDLAEATHRASPGKLQLIGWGGPAQPSADLPGQPRGLEACIQGPGTVFLDWKAPAAGTGGRVRYYRVERRVRDLGTNTITEDWGAWQRSATASEYTATEQPRGKEIDYRVFAVNDNGDSMPSNTVMAVL